jgi:uncharacterized protein (TIRG00374 family)
MKYWKSLLQAIISLSLLLLLFQLVDWRQGFNALAEADPLLMLLSLALYPLGLLIGAWRWRFFLSPFGVRPTLRKAFCTYWVGAFVSNFLPSSIGGDLSRIYLFKNYRMTAQITASVLVERASGVSVAIAFALVGLYLQEDTLHFSAALGEMLFGILLVATLILIILISKGAAILESLETFCDGRLSFIAQYC